MNKILKISFAILLSSGLYAQSRFMYLSTNDKVYFKTSNEMFLLEYKKNISADIKSKYLASRSLESTIASKPKQMTGKYDFVRFEEPISFSSPQFKSTLDAALQDTAFASLTSFLIYGDGNLQAISDRIIVKLKNEVAFDEFERLLKSFKISKVEPNLYSDNEYIITIDNKKGEKDALDIANSLFETGKFEYSQVDFIRLIKPYTNDPAFKQQWALTNTGANVTNGTNDADMDVPEAWCLSTGSNIKVAVIDQGVELTHPDLQANLLPGYDATGGGSNGGYSGNDAHGTASAGIIAAVGDNNLGVAGVSYNSKIIPVRNGYEVIVNGNSSSVIMDSWIAAGINWAVAAGADVLSNSWGGISESSTVTNAINNAVSNGRSGKGCVVLFASGNANSNVVYPASLSSVIAVGASTMCDTRKSPSSCDGETTWGSNYGTGLDVVAPGVKIQTTDLTGSLGYNTLGDIYNNFNGTSAACPYVAGVVALILAVNPNLTQAEVRQILESTTDKVAGYSYSINVSGQPNGTWNNEVGYGRVNANKAVLYAKSFNSYISGQYLVCSANDQGAIYTLSNPPSGLTSFTWSSVGASINPTTGKITAISSGVATLSANVTYGSCGSFPVTKKIWMGGPPIPVVTGASTLCPGFTSLYSASIPSYTGYTGSANYGWSYPNLTLGTGTYPNNTIALKAPANFTSGSAMAFAFNQCGGAAAPGILGINKPYNCPNGLVANTYVVSPNPATTSVSIAKASATQSVATDSTVSTVSVSSFTIADVSNASQETIKETPKVEIFDKYLVCRKTYLNQDISKSIDIRGLESGVYYMVITDSQHIERHQLVVQ